MTTPVLDLSAEELAQYRQTAARRQLERASKMKARMAQAWELARKAAKVLREQYHAERVVVFGPCFMKLNSPNGPTWTLPPGAFQPIKLSVPSVQ